MPPHDKPKIDDLTLPDSKEISLCNGVKTSFRVKGPYIATTGAALNASVTVGDLEYLWSGTLKETSTADLYTADIQPVDGFGVDCRRNRRRIGYGVTSISFTVQNPPAGDGAVVVSDATAADLDVVEN